MKIAIENITHPVAPDGQREIKCELTTHNNSKEVKNLEHAYHEWKASLDAACRRLSDQGAYLVLFKDYPSESQPSSIVQALHDTVTITYEKKVPSNVTGENTKTVISTKTFYMAYACTDMTGRLLDPRQVATFTSFLGNDLMARPTSRGEV